MYSTTVFLEKVFQYDYMPAIGVDDLEAVHNCTYYIGRESLAIK